MSALRVRKRLSHFALTLGYHISRARCPPYGGLPMRNAMNPPANAGGTDKTRCMADDHKEPSGEVETALLDAELFIKYGSVDRALKRLRTALDKNPRSIRLRERMREVAAAHKHPEEAARHCLALASLYIERDNFDAAHDRLLEAKTLDNRISIGTGLEAIRRARHPELYGQPATKTAPPRAKPGVTFAGDLATISVFDAIQAIENSRLTGALVLTNNGKFSGNY